MSKIEEPWKAKLPGGTRADTAQAEPAPHTGRDEVVGYFGYGSLVNRATLRTEILAAIPARLNGWRRTWRPRPLMDADTMAETALAGSVVPSLLSAHRAEEASIDGVLIIDLAVNLPVIDAREFRYHRRDITLAELSLDIERAERETGLRLDAATRLHVPDYPDLQGALIAIRGRRQLSKYPPLVFAGRGAAPEGWSSSRRQPGGGVPAAGRRLRRKLRGVLRRHDPRHRSRSCCRWPWC
jgi:hypothetical protein